MKRAIYIFAIFLNAFLLFLVQPMIAKRILPTFGGSPVVWNIALLFFQVVLLLGYVTAHRILSRAVGTKKLWLYFACLAAGLVVLPVRLPMFVVHAYRNALEANPNSFGAQPGVGTFAILAIAVGLPFFALSMGAPTLQRWFSTTDDPHAEKPYFLYAASNIGSLSALLVYPFVLEPRFTNTQISVVWSVAYLGLLALIYLCSRSARFEQLETANSVEPETEAVSRVVWKERLTWAGLAAGPSAALVALSHYASLNVAPMPLLWVVPLSLYLLSFVFAFSERVQFKSKWWGIAIPILTFPSMMKYGMNVYDPIRDVLAIHFAAFFCVALVGHCTVASIKPGPRRLTEFFVWLSIGGAAGGLFSSVVAPLIFNDLYELPLCFGFSAVMVSLALSPGIERARKSFATLIGVALIVLISYLRLKYHSDGGEIRFYWLAATFVAIIGSIPQPLLCSAAFAAFTIAMSITENIDYRQPDFLQRSFFGVHLVRRMGISNSYKLVNGNTTHGIQDQNEPRRPTTYYSPHSGLGLVMAKLGPERLKTCGLVGLGVGTTAAYGEKGQKFEFYELDPSIYALAMNRKFFTYLSDCRAEVTMRIGDARLRMEEAKDGGYDFISLDAFASDSVPVHLLTLEAFQMYLKKLAPHGILAVHVSNKYLRLEKVVGSTAHRLGLKAYIVDSGNRPQRDGLDFRSRWIILARSDQDLDGLEKTKDFEPLTESGQVWTDDTSDVLSIVKWEEN